MNDAPDNTPVLEQDELAALKARATMMNLSFHPSIGLDKLREKVAAAIAGTTSEDEATGKEDAPATKPVETEAQKRLRMKRDAERLVRIRLTCMNPMKKDWPGEVITVGNSAVGTLKKFIPFTADEGWHVPHFMYEQLKSRQCQVFVTTKTKHGVSVRQGKLINEFAIEVLPQLDQEELADLARRQAMAKAID